MRRRLLPLAWLGLAVLAIGVLLAVLHPAPPATREEQARVLAAELRCPDCESLSVAESRTASAAAIREEISQQLAAGRTPAEIRASFVARYGEWILLQPTSPLIWILPLVALLAGVALFGWWLLGRRTAPEPVSAQIDTAADRQRVRDEAELLDG